MVKITTAALAVVAVVVAVVAPAVVAVVAPADVAADFGSRLNWSDCIGMGFTGKSIEQGWNHRYYCGQPLTNENNYCWQNGSNEGISDEWCEYLTTAFKLDGHPAAPDVSAWQLKVPNGGPLREVTCYKANGEMLKEVYRDGGSPIQSSGQCYGGQGIFKLSAYPDWCFNGKPRTLASVMGAMPATPNSNPDPIPNGQQCFFDHVTFPGLTDSDECRYGSRCTKHDQWWSGCERNPNADHECCISLNQWDCQPGECCAGNKCEIDANNGHNRCVEDFGPNFEISTGIPTCHANHAGWSTQKTVKSIYNTCYDPASWSLWDKGNVLPQGDCATGLACMGNGESGQCHPDPELFNAGEHMNYWETHCRAGDCRPGSFCKHFYHNNGDLRWTQCRWGEEKGCMRHAGNTVGCDDDCTDPLVDPSSDCYPVHDGIVSIPDVTRSYHEELGTCVGAICSVWGDPHIVSCDNKKWDCQGEGLFTYMSNPMFDIQTHFVQLDTPLGSSASITNGVAIDNKMVDEAPKIQFMFPPMEDPDTDVYPAESEYIGNCPVMMHIDGQMVDISSTGTYYYNEETEDMPPPPPNSILYEVEGSMKVWRVNWGNIMIEYTDADGAVSTIMIKSGGSGPHTGWSCIFSLFVCLPAAHEEMFKGASYGLAGTPDGDFRNDWIDWEGTSHEYGGRAAAFDFCTSTYCVSPSDNIMVFPAGKTFSDYMCKDQVFHDCTKDKLINDLGLTPESIAEQCGAESIDSVADSASCLVEMCANGEALQEEEDEVDDINENGNPEDPNAPVDVDDDCEDLGAFLSEATGPYALPVTPKVDSCDAHSTGYDQSVSVLVGKDYHCMQGIGMEGSLVVMDDLIVDSNANGCTSFVTTVDGSCVHPEVGTRCIQVGDSVSLGTSADQRISIMQDSVTMSCHTVFGGSCAVGDAACAETKTGLAESFIYTNGEMKQDTELDLSSFTTELQILKQKQAYWSTWFPETSTEPNGVIEIDAALKTMTLKAGADYSCEQVFNMDASDFDGIDTLKFDSSLASNLILINVAGANPTIEMPMMLDTAGVSGTGYEQFDTKMTSSILWNFFESENGYVTLTGDVVQGSVIVAGDLIFKAKAHLGRLVVHGNLVQDGPESVFLNYPFSPQCPLPLPPNTDEVCTVQPTPPCVESTYREMTSDEACPNGSEVVKLLSAKGVVPDGEPIIYGIEMMPGLSTGSQVKFKIDNPFVGKSDIYVKYEKKVGDYGLDPECDRKNFVEGCDPDAYEEAEIIAGCVEHEGIDPYTIVHVYFASKDNEFAFFDTEIDKCCHAPDYASLYGYEVYEFTFEIKCACPSGTSEIV